MSGLKRSHGLELLCWSTIHTVVCKYMLLPKTKLDLDLGVTESTNLGSLCKQKLGFFRETIWPGEKKQMDMVIRQRRE